MRTRYEYTREQDKKFWEIETNGRSYTVVQGRTGYPPYSERTVSFGSSEEAERDALRAMKNKRKAGFRPMAVSEARNLRQFSKDMERALFQAIAAYQDKLPKQTRGKPRKKDLPGVGCVSCAVYNWAEIGWAVIRDRSHCDGRYAARGNSTERHMGSARVTLPQTIGRRGERKPKKTYEELRLLALEVLRRVAGSPELHALRPQPKITFEFHCLGFKPHSRLVKTLAPRVAGQTATKSTQSKSSKGRAAGQRVRKACTDGQIASLERLVGRKLARTTRRFFTHELVKSDELHVLSFEPLSASNSGREFRTMMGLREEPELPDDTWDTSWLPLSNDGAGNLHYVDLRSGRVGFACHDPYERSSCGLTLHKWLRENKLRTH